jgi:hypothetical protein
MCNFSEQANVFLCKRLFKIGNFGKQHRINSDFSICSQIVCQRYKTGLFQTRQKHGEQVFMLCLPCLCYFYYSL